MRNPAVFNGPGLGLANRCIMRPKLWTVVWAANLRGLMGLSVSLFTLSDMRVFSPANVTAAADVFDAISIVAIK